MHAWLRCCKLGDGQASVKPLPSHHCRRLINVPPALPRMHAWPPCPTLPTLHPLHGARDAGTGRVLRHTAFQELATRARTNVEASQVGEAVPVSHGFLLSVSKAPCSVAEEVELELRGEGQGGEEGGGVCEGGGGAGVRAPRG